MLVRSDGVVLLTSNSPIQSGEIKLPYLPRLVVAFCCAVFGFAVGVYAFRKRFRKMLVRYLSAVSFRSLEKERRP